MKHVAVVGGGLAGLAAGLACADAGLRVTLLEARPRLGGATWSSERGGIEIDNGQHVFLRCCAQYLGFLRRLGVEDRVVLQPRLTVPVRAPGGRTAWIRRQALPAPLHLAASLLRFGHLPLRDRLRAARTLRRLARLPLADPALDERRLGDWLAEQGEGVRAVDVFWDLLVRPTLNLPAREASLALAVKVFQTGLLEDAAAGDVGYARVPLARLHAEPAARALVAAGARVALRTRVRALEPGDAASPARVHLAGGAGSLEADAVVLATPHQEAAALLPPGSGIDPQALRGLGAEPIVNLHVVFDRHVTRLPLLATVDSPVQWVFDRTRSAGLARGQYLAISLSAAREWVGRSRAELEGVFLPELARVLPGVRSARLERFLVTCEREATFRQAPGTRRLRPGPATTHPRLFLAGAWTDTGWPATMEGAVRSGVDAARGVLRALGRERGLPALAAA